MGSTINNSYGRIDFYMKATRSSKYLHLKFCLQNNVCLSPPLLPSSIIRGIKQVLTLPGLKKKQSSVLWSYTVPGCSIHFFCYSEGKRSYPRVMLLYSISFGLHRACYFTFNNNRGILRIRRVLDRRAGIKWGSVHADCLLTSRKPRGKFLCIMSIEFGMTTKLVRLIKMFLKKKTPW